MNLDEIQCRPDEQRLFIKQNMEAAQRRLCELEDKRRLNPLDRVEIYEMDGLKNLIINAKRWFKDNQ